MRIDILTLFPLACDAFLRESIIGRARKNGLIEIYCHNIRDYTEDKHRRVDDTPYGGGMGMLMQAEPIARCFEAVCAEIGCRPHLIYLSPQGQVFRQQRAAELSKLNNIVLLCGHYEGIDERFTEEYVDEEISVGDFVLTGGELPALTVVDCIARMLPGVLADQACFTEESHFSGLLEYPQYTRPPVWRGKEIPDILTSGDHAKIDRWRQEQAMERTAKRRPDMMEEWRKNHPAADAKKKK